MTRRKLSEGRRRSRRTGPTAQAASPPGPQKSRGPHCEATGHASSPAASGILLDTRPCARSRARGSPARMARVSSAPARICSGYWSCRPNIKSTHLEKQPRKCSVTEWLRSMFGSRTSNYRASLRSSCECDGSIVAVVVGNR